MTSTGRRAGRVSYLRFLPLAAVVLAGAVNAGAGHWGDAVYAAVPLVALALVLVRRARR